MSAARELPQALPTLLTSRPQLPYHSKEAAAAAKSGEPLLPYGGKDLVRRGREPPSPPPPCSGQQEDLPEGFGEAQQALKLPEAYALPIRIHNTFIDTAAERSPSLERFYREREVSTCPSAHIGRFSRLFQGADEALWASDDETEDTQLPSEAHETRSVSEASPCNAAARAGPSCVLSLAEALSPPLEVPCAPTWDSQLACAGGYVDATASSHEVQCIGSAGEWCFPCSEISPPQCAAADGCYLEAGFAYAAGEECRGAFGEWRPYSWSEVLPQCAAMGGCPVEETPVDMYLAESLARSGGADGMWLPPVTGLEPPAVPAPPDRPAPGSEEMPSMGSAAHSSGGCKPCAFFHNAGCANGLTCEFCHLCGPDERKRRRRAKLEARRTEKTTRAGRRDAEASDDPDARLDVEC